jgi:hypothetical protein
VILPETLLARAESLWCCGNQKNKRGLPMVAPDAASAASFSPLFGTALCYHPKNTSLLCANHHLIQKAG